MLFDLRVVLAACLATLLFAAAGLGLIASSRSPFKAPPGYARNEGPGLAGPGLPQSRPLPVLEEAKPEVTGTIAEAPEAPVEPPAAKAAKETKREAKKETKSAPQLSAKKQSITSLIEEDSAQQERATKDDAKKAAVKKKPRHVRHRPKQPPKQTNPWSVFTNNNNATATR